MNKNAVVVFNGTRQHTFTGDASCLVPLNPGSNVVSIAKLEQLQDKDKGSESFIEALINEEIIILESGVDKAETTEKSGSVVKNPADDSIVLNVTEMGAREAVAAINTETDVEKIRKYLADEKTGESRPTIVNACNIAINNLTKADDSDA